MSLKKEFVCDVCQKPIESGHDQYYMATVTVDYTIQVNDGSAAGTEKATDVYHVHNGFSKHCMGKLWDVLEKNRK